MEERLVRVGTTYIPVQNVERSAEWYVSKLSAQLNYQDENKAILNLADQSVFLVKAQKGQTSNFIDANGFERFSMTFEVDGESALKAVHEQFSSHGIDVGEIEDRGHPGINFTFKDLDGNIFDVWSELSAKYKTAMLK